MNIEETKQAIAVMQAYVDGKEIERRLRGGHDWYSFGDCGYGPPWDWGNVEYRVRVTKPSINWDHVAPCVAAIVKSVSGLGLGCLAIPEENDEYSSGWKCPANMMRVDHFASYTPGTCDWKDSLVVRPGYEGDE